MKLPLALSVTLNCVLLTVLVAVAVRYKLFDKAQRVFLEEGRIPLVKRSYELNRNYDAFREIFAHYQDEERPILVLGDSHTAQLDWNAFLSRVDIAARGIDGDTSEGLLHRLSDLDLNSVKTVVIWIGSNDVLTGVSSKKLVENIQSIAGFFTSKGVSDIRVCAVMPLASWIDSAEVSNAKISEANALLEEFCRANNVRFVDVAEVVVDSKGYMSHEHTSDGLHLSASGYQKVATSIFADEVSH